MACTSTDRFWKPAVVHATAGDAGARIVAFLSAHAQRPSIVELKTFCAARLPSYMSPDVFLFLEALPRTSTDKIDYQRLTHLAGASLQSQ